MSTVYADRIFVSMNGLEVLDVESVSAKMSDGTKYVPTMTRNRRHKGTVGGNRDINLNITVAVQNKLGTPKIEDLDYENNDVAITYEVGADRYTFSGVSFVDVDLNGSGVGSEVKKAFNMLALDCVDQVGNSTLFPTSISTKNAG